MRTATKELTRFDARLPKEQKLLFEKAALLGGYRNLTDFVIHTANEKAKEIIDENEKIIASERDSKIFFDAITHPGSPTVELKKAYEEYQTFMSNADVNND